MIVSFLCMLWLFNENQKCCNAVTRISVRLQGAAVRTNLAAVFSSSHNDDGTCDLCLQSSQAGSSALFNQDTEAGRFMGSALWALRDIPHENSHIAELLLFLLQHGHF